jgi:hypothetical protein
VNFLLRTPLWPATKRDSHPVGGLQARQVLVLDDHELAAGKLAALLARSAARDLYDARQLLQRPDIDMERLRVAFVVYGGVNREDWRTRTLEHVHASPSDVAAQLVPMLRDAGRPGRREVADWTVRLISETRALLAPLLPLRAHEVEFLTQLNDGGEVRPELLTDDAVLQDAIRMHPGLAWKALNVRRHRGLE